MKSLLKQLFLLCFILTDIISQSGWYAQNSGVNNNLKYFSNFYPAASILGSGGAFLITSNGGYNWFVQNMNTNSALNCRISNIIVCDNGLIFKTTNNGVNWFQVFSGTTHNLNWIVASLSNRILITADYGTVLLSTNTGNNWQVMNLNTPNNITCAVFVNTHAVAVGQNGYISRSTDYGVTWNTVNSGVSENINQLVYFSNDTLFACAGNGKILQTTNFGITWSVVSTGVNVNLNSLYILQKDNQQKYIWVAGDYGFIKYSTDRGISWINSPSGVNAKINCINGFSSDMYVTGEQGMILNFTLGSGYFDSTFIDANNAKPYILNNGLVHQKSVNEYEGFIWPKNTTNAAVFTSGLLIAAKVNDSIRAMANYYEGEGYPGYFDHVTRTPYGKNNPEFRIYKVNPNLPSGNGVFDSWSVWPINQGALWIDMNNNGIYEPPGDKPVMKGDQNTFCRFTDGYPESHTALAGSTRPLNADILLYTYAIENQQCADIHFMEYEIVNKNNAPWDSTYVGFISDTELGSAFDDRLGCDSMLNIGFCYNSSNYDNVYGLQPPAIGFVIYDATGHSGRYMDFFNHPAKNQNEPTSSAETFNLLKGLKKDGTAWIDPINNLSTRYVLSGDPESGTGWIDNTSSDKRVLLSSKFNSVLPLDTVRFFIATIIKRGNNNLNSVTQLKNCINQGLIGIKNTLPTKPLIYKLYQNYPNPFNPVTKIRFDIPKKTKVTILIYDLLGRVLSYLINGVIMEAGSHVVDWNGKEYASGVYICKLETEEYFSVKKMIMLK